MEMVMDTRDTLYDSPEALLPMREVVRRTGLAKTTIYREIRRGKFPAGVHYGFGPRVRWIASEVDGWVQEKVRAARSARRATGGTATAVKKQ